MRLSLARNTSASVGAFAALFVVAILASPANATLSDWQAAVAAGTPAGYTNTNITSPIVADIGLYDETTNGGVSYEFIVNATNDGDSSALMGKRGTPAPGDAAALKWEQFANTEHYGTTVFGVADFEAPVTNTPNVDTHVVFVNNSVSTRLYVNGALAFNILGSSPTLAGTVGIGQAYDPSGNFDPLTGTILGVAVYDHGLSADEIAAHSEAFFIPEPSGLALAFGAVVCLLLRRSAR
jgi:hypothetical protein